MLNADNIKFRAHASGHIMTEPVGKSNLDKLIEATDSLGKAKAAYALIKNKEPKTAIKTLNSIDSLEKKIPELALIKDEVNLSESCITHLIDIFVSQKYNRHSQINSKYLDKGNEVEEDSITVLCLLDGIRYEKNEITFENDFFIGTPDVLKREVSKLIKQVKDTKSAWDIFTFYRAIYKKIKDLYYWQIMTYIDLTGAESGTIDYCLNNTPYHLIEAELRKESYQYEENNTPAWVELQIIANHVYDKKTFEEYYNRRNCLPLDDKNALAVVAGFVEIPLEERHFEFKVERNDEEIERMHQRVIDCRKYMNKHLFKIA
ncbi:MAG: hypothetical protein V4687_16230 [Bacteroidota bacterium]